jgi:hypothetical protein
MGFQRGSCEIPTASSTGDVVCMHMRSGFNVRRGGADDAAVFEDFLAAPDWMQRELVASRNSIADGQEPLGHANRGTRFKRLERGRNVVATADYDGRVHDSLRCLHCMPGAASRMVVQLYDQFSFVSRNAGASRVVLVLRHRYTCVPPARDRNSTVWPC